MARISVWGSSACSEYFSLSYCLSSPSISSLCCFLFSFSNVYHIVIPYLITCSNFFIDICELFTCSIDSEWYYEKMGRYLTPLNEVIIFLSGQFFPSSLRTLKIFLQREDNLSNIIIVQALENVKIQILFEK